ncbi:hypothetical protein EV356DRAFT_453500 [Viridothelium virens]|uniref:Uncharacterized protein n=1 Tax=Viridothelium virens TaxID=1048519 RepID=A0A6A6GZ38_VIRVR|nr:hypothetical protein EV356DRAFT_453500 [Viridothelium virens]
MASHSFLLTLLTYILLTFSPVHVASQTTAAPTVTSSTVSARSSTVPRGNTTAATTTGNAATSTVPDVFLNVPTLSVGKIQLIVENLQADVNLNAAVGNSLVNINAGVQVGIQKVNLTITDVDVELELVVRLGNLVNIVNRVFSSLDLNPILIDAVNGVTNLLDDVVGEVDGLLGSITQGGKTLSFLVDNLGNIVQQLPDAAGNLVNTIVGNYAQNMTYTGQSTNLGQGLTQKVYSYSPLNALVDIVFNTAGQIVQATVAKQSGSSSSSSSASATATATSSASA